MYTGQIVESATVTRIFERASHPYTKGLLNAIPQLTGRLSQRLQTIKGNVPHPTQIPTGCRFAPRCTFATDQCQHQTPELEAIDSDQMGPLF